MEHWRFDPETCRPGEGDVWDHARREYLSGQTAATICRRYGMSLRSFRLHARVERWRRIDRDDCDIEPEAGEYHPDDDVGFADLADQVFLNIRRAVGSGRAAEASSWMRLFDKLADRASNEVMADLPDFPPPEPVPAPASDPVRDPLLLTSVEEMETSNKSNPVRDDPNLGSEKLHLWRPVFSERETVAEPEAGPEETPADGAALSISGPLEDMQRKALLLLRSRRLALGMEVSDLDRQLAALGPGP